MRKENLGLPNLMDESPTEAGPSMERGLEDRISSTDPLLLRPKLVSKDTLKQLRGRGSNGKKVADFYENQNELIEGLLKPPDYRDEDEEAQLFKLKLAVNGSFAVNILLFCLQLVGALLSGSLSLLATTADAFMDIASNGVLVFANRIASSGHNLNYPTGKARYETAGIIVFATLMATLSLQLIIESVRSLTSSDHNIQLGVISISFIGVALVFKFFLYLFCVSLSKYPSARILAQDHRNDLILNITGIAFGLLGQYVRWYIDPIGGILIALLILRSWASAAQEHIQLIVGKSADTSFLNRVTYLSMTHDPRVKQVDTCRAYYAGSKYVVEVDIVLPADMPLCEAHDIGEALQIKIETLEEVERAFVHLDHETSHRPEHQKSI
ncbi:hypothetical protein BDV3_000133 [Batrachochytrium dendrobatidis]|uniref:Uncharacterized protein n=1 Tax=Batrachochytrium dendrobatidis (strain JEL423) TaxID=403673 RepID=A0A177WBH0_BATDL|nr:hypothetical protein BDEG_21151 [Batrachochytrium dendrobatidis JEL423]